MHIERNVLIPETSSHKYPFSSMSVGDSFLVENDGQFSKATNAAYMYGKRNGQKFRSKKCGEGVRIWRIL